MRKINHSPRRGFDVAVFVATTGERDAVINCTKKLNNAKWAIEHDGNGEPISTMLLRNRSGRTLRIALQTLPSMGAEACVYYVLRFLTMHPCPLVAMVGICAGEKKETKKGDIIVPGRVACIFGGKEFEDSNGEVRFRPNNRLHSISEKVRKELSYFSHMHWPDVSTEIKEHQRDLGVPENTSTSLKFEEKIVMAQVAHVRAYSSSFDDLKDYASREVTALEMESAALAYVVERVGEGKSHWLVIKGVQDYADSKKDHRYRKFCSWASFFTLTKFLETANLDLWDEKVRTAEFNERGSTAETIDQLNDAYNQGNFSEAVRIGDEIFGSFSHSPTLWRPYIRALLRQQLYEKAADIIGIVDYQIQESDTDGAHVIDYLVEKAEYYRRIGFSQDATAIAQLVIACSESALREQRAQAYYIRGRISLRNYRNHGEPQSIEDSERYFQAAVNLSPNKYWAEISLLIVKFVKTGRNPFLTYSIDNLLDSINRQITAFPTRPAPRIYRLKYLALRTACGDIEFAEFESTVIQDASENNGLLTLPPDFFQNLDSDFKLIFENHKDRYRAISLMYKWAALTSTY